VICGKVFNEAESWRGAAVVLTTAIDRTVGYTDPTCTDLIKGEWSERA
jgi:hypothetical protein